MEFVDDIITGRLYQRGNRIFGRFPYGKSFTISDRATGRNPRKERFLRGSLNPTLARFNRLQQELAEAIQESIEEVQIELIQEQLDRSNIYVLEGHDYNKTFGSLRAGNVRMTDTDESFNLEVDLPPESRRPTYMVDALKNVDNGFLGLSPGFRTPPPSRVVGGGQRLVQDPGEPAGITTRELVEVNLHEMSLVSRPNSILTEVEVRSETDGNKTDFHDICGDTPYGFDSSDTCRSIKIVQRPVHRRYRPQRILFLRASCRVPMRWWTNTLMVVRFRLQFARKLAYVFQHNYMTSWKVAAVIVLSVL